jgi:hypothetical protein
MEKARHTSLLVWLQVSLLHVYDRSLLKGEERIFFRASHMAPARVMDGVH